jgi:serine/threonine protein kinase
MMPKLKKQIQFETTFGAYVVDELIGEGGAGRVYGGIGLEGNAIAVKLLAEGQASTDKRRRFKNEIGFLSRNKHSNIVTVIDHGVAHGGDIAGPFYVMRRYHGSLRELIRNKIEPKRVLPLFSQILDGVEAAHLQGVVHRDLKPENILCDKDLNSIAIADFGIASFTEDILVTLVETSPAQRLANFQYAAPEQRTPGNPIQASADVYALGLMLNEMFTGAVPHGTDYRSIEQISKELGFLDPIVAKMLRQAPGERPASISDLKALIQLHQGEAVSLQRLSDIEGTVIKTSEIDEPLAQEAPRLVGADWNRGKLTLTLDRPTNKRWHEALLQMGSYSAVMGKPPAAFSFNGKQAFIDANEHEVQSLIDHFKSWLPQATRKLKELLQQETQREDAHRKEALRIARQAEEQRIRVLKNIRL